MESEGAPQRADVERVWMGLIAGGMTRGEAHHWAAQWVERSAEPPELMAMRGLQYVHGYDVLRKSDVEMRQDFERWKADCAAYDRDPRGWLRGRLEIAQRAVAEGKA